ncbi:uncharacterized protein mtrf1l isoform X1 [Pungitius pungitius]|uniref:uncharacterized protein mtrf1l isoform X1 n=1 Tax=Pungitius pungitius TaxID=134920 RepID=UPI002E12E52A
MRAQHVCALQQGPSEPHTASSIELMAHRRAAHLLPRASHCVSSLWVPRLQNRPNAIGQTASILRPRSLHTAVPSRAAKLLSLDELFSKRSLQQHLKELQAEYAECLKAASSAEDEPRADRTERTRVSLLAPLVQSIRELDTKRRQLAETETLLSDEDAALRELAELEHEGCQREIEDLRQKILDQLLPEEEADLSDLVLEVTAGVGGVRHVSGLRSAPRLVLRHPGAHDQRNRGTASRLGLGQRPPELQEDEVRGRSPSCAEGSPDGEAGPDAHQHHDGGGAAATHRDLLHHKPQRPEDRNQEGERSRGAARQHHRQRGADPPPAHRRGGGVPAGTLPDKEQGESHEGSESQAVQQEAGGGDEPALQPAESADRHQGSIREDPDLQLLQGPCDGPPPRHHGARRQELPAGGGPPGPDELLAAGVLQPGGAGGAAGGDPAGRRLRSRDQRMWMLAFYSTEEKV